MTFTNTSFLGRITIPGRDVWAIDSTVLIVGTTRYLVYSSWDGASKPLSLDLSKYQSTY